VWFVGRGVCVCVTVSPLVVHVSARGHTQQANTCSLAPNQPQPPT
jgi:hypothetical protein